MLALGRKRLAQELPKAMPARNVTSMIANAYVELPITPVNARVQATSYVIATKPEIASVTRTSRSDFRSKTASSSSLRDPPEISGADSRPRSRRIATRPIAMFIEAIQIVVV